MAFLHQLPAVLADIDGAFRYMRAHTADPDPVSHIESALSVCVMGECMSQDLLPVIIPRGLNVAYVAL